MAEKFSSTLRLSDLNDFITPSQACVVNLGRLQTSEIKERVPTKDFKDFVQARAKASNEPVKITLHDCLACSGCITSSETVILEQQSTNELENKLQSSEFVVIVSLSPQSRAALASHFHLSPLQVFKKLTGFLKSLGAKAVLDTSFSRDLSLMEACSEFVERYRRSSNLEPSSDVNPSMPLPMLASSCPGWICYAEKTHGDYILPYISTTKSPQQIMGAVVKRYLSQQLGLSPSEIYHVTIMPCYDKKLEASRDDFLMDFNRHDLDSEFEPDFDSDLNPNVNFSQGECNNKSEYDEECEKENIRMLNHASNGHGNGITMDESESSHGEDALARNGNGAKVTVGEDGRLKGKRRKKRAKARIEDRNVAEVDCVLTSEELLSLFEKQGVDFANLPEAPLDKICSNVDEEGHLFGVRGGSGGYAETIFAYAAKNLFGKDVKNEQIEWKVLRNSDFKEVFLEVNGKQVLAFACAYGFRNIQNLVRKIKSKKCPYQFVEIMACPGGCLTGGGQIKMKKGTSLKDHLLEMERAYLQEVNVGDPFENPLATKLYQCWLGHPFSQKAQNILHTSYHPRTSSLASNLANW